MMEVIELINQGLEASDSHCQFYAQNLDWAMRMREEYGEYYQSHVDDFAQRLLKALEAHDRWQLKLDNAEIEYGYY